MRNSNGLDLVFRQALAQDRVAKLEVIRNRKPHDTAFQRAIDEAREAKVRETEERARQEALVVGADVTFDVAMARGKINDREAVEREIKPLLTTAQSMVAGVTEVVKTQKEQLEEAIATLQQQRTEIETLKNEVKKLDPFSDKIVDRTVLSKTPLKKARDWQLDFGPVSAPAGKVCSITVLPNNYFRAEKMMASDTASPAGTGTRILQVLVNGRVQRSAAAFNGTLTSFFSQGALGNGIRWDTCQRGMQISVTVSFVQSVTFDMSLFGRAIE